MTEDENYWKCPLKIKIVAGWHRIIKNGAHLKIIKNGTQEENWLKGRELIHIGNNELEDI